MRPLPGAPISGKQVVLVCAQGPKAVTSKVTSRAHDLENSVGHLCARQPGMNLPAPPRWTPENRPVVDGSNPASGEDPKHECSTPVVRKNARLRGRWRAESRRPGGCPDMARREIVAPGGSTTRAVDRSTPHDRVLLAAVKPGAPASVARRSGRCAWWREPIEQCGDGRGVAEQLPPVLDRAIRSDQGGGTSRIGA